MFTIGAIILGVLLAWLAGRANEKDRSMYDREISEGHASYLDLHIRQDLKLIAFLLGGIIVMLGVVADKIH